MSSVTLTHPRIVQTLGAIAPTVANVVFYGWIDTKEETGTGVIEQPINHSSLFTVSVTWNRTHQHAQEILQ